ncbi:MAG: 3-hydroxyacyl-CoA dehydrogenase family protein [Anaerolineae bacterium]
MAVLGAGTMGSGIAQVAAAAGHRVVLYDVVPGALETGAERLRTYLRRGAEKGRTTAAEAEAAIGRLHTTSMLDAISGADLVIEAAPEDLDLKTHLLSEAEALVSAECILATNTSTLSVSSMARGLRRPGMLCGLHFFNPAPLMPLVEVVKGFDTSDQVLATAVALAESWGKTPIVVRDTPGFVVNRVARPFYGEALRLAGDGVADVACIDRLARDAGFPMGPFELMDLIGIDVNLAAAMAVYEGYFQEPRFRPHPLQRRMVASGRLGRKTGLGYYTYEDS